MKNNNNNGRKTSAPTRCCTHLFWLATSTSPVQPVLLFLSRRNKHTQTHTHTHAQHTLIYFHITQEIIQYAQFPTAFYICSKRAQRVRLRRSRRRRKKTRVKFLDQSTLPPLPLPCSRNTLCYTSSCRTRPYSMGSFV